MGPTKSRELVRNLFSSAATCSSSNRERISIHQVPIEAKYGPTIDRPSKTRRNFGLPELSSGKHSSIAQSDRGCGQILSRGWHQPSLLQHQGHNPNPRTASRDSFFGDDRSRRSSDFQRAVSRSRWEISILCSSTARGENHGTARHVHMHHPREHESSAEGLCHLCVAWIALCLHRRLGMSIAKSKRMYATDRQTGGSVRKN